LERSFLFETSIVLSNGQMHRFDLATATKDVIAECKAYTWTESGNVPSAKITHLRESLQLLNAIPGSAIRHLIMKKANCPGRNETLGEYFVRLNEVHIGTINIFELSEDGLNLRCLRGGLNKVGICQQPAKFTKNAEPIDVETLGRMRRSLFQILDLAEGLERRDEGPAKRVSRLRSEQKIPRNIANCMHTILGFRDSAEYDGHPLTESESTAVRGAWDAILEWGRQKGMDLLILH
jgi:hypothetical protein